MNGDGVAQAMSLREAFVRACEIGGRAARANGAAAAVILLCMVPVVVGYYAGWPSTRVLEFLAYWNVQGGLWFSFLSTALAGGVLSEVAKVCLLQRGEWRDENTREGFFKFVMMGIGGVLVTVFYSFQDRLFGTEVRWEVVVLKVAVDQGLYSPLLACPLPVIVNHFRTTPFSWGEFARCFTPGFYLNKILPLVIPNSCFWLPATFLLYSLPSTLQFAFFLCLVTIWGMVFTSIVARRGAH